jgi:hypothetical protein
MKILGIVIVVLGLIGTFAFGIQAMNRTHSLNIFGNAFSSVSWLPITVSIVLLIGGILLLASAQKR